jgi:hypothetical protein
LADLAVTALFVQKKALSCFGYTSTMLQILRQSVVWHLRSKTYSMGAEEGVPEETIEACFGRMRSWMILARASMAAEFPSWEIAQDTIGQRI